MPKSWTLGRYVFPFLRHSILNQVPKDGQPFKLIVKKIKIPQASPSLKVSLGASHSQHHTLSFRPPHTLAVPSKTVTAASVC